MIDFIFAACEYDGVWDDNCKKERGTLQFLSSEILFKYRGSLDRYCDGGTIGNMV